MGPFSGAGVELLGILIFAAIALGIWLFNAGRRSAMAEKPEAPKTPAAPAAPAAPQFENFLACDRCAKETDRLLRRDGGPELCEECFKSEPLFPRHNNPSSPTSASG